MIDAHLCGAAEHRGWHLVGEGDHGRTIEQRLAEFMTSENLPRDEAVKAFMGTRQPSGRFVAPERVAGLVAFLCGPDGVDTTGSAISVDGGWSAA